MDRMSAAPFSFCRAPGEEVPSNEETRLIVCTRNVHRVADIGMLLLPRMFPESRVAVPWLLLLWSCEFRACQHSGRIPSPNGCGQWSGVPQVSASWR